MKFKVIPPLLVLLATLFSCTSEPQGSSSFSSSEDSMSSEGPSSSSSFSSDPDSASSSEAVDDGFVFGEAEGGYALERYNGTSENIVIPSTYLGQPVVEIGGSALAYSRHNDDILSIVIPDSVREIGHNAFYNRSETTSIEIGENSQLTIIGNNVFSGNSSLKSIYIPAGVTSIGDSAFNNDYSIEFEVAEGNANYLGTNGHLIEKATMTLVRGGQSEEIPSGVLALEDACFRRGKMDSISIPATVASFGNYLFDDSDIVSISYEGSEEQWEEIEKESRWNMGKEDIPITYGS